MAAGRRPNRTSGGGLPRDLSGAVLRRGQAPRDASGHFTAWGSFQPRDKDGRVIPLSALPPWVVEKIQEGRKKLREAARRASEERAEAERRARAERRRQRAEAARAEAERLELQRQERNRRRRERAEAQRAEAQRVEAERQARVERRRKLAAERRERAAAEALRAEAERQRAEAERQRAEAERLAAERAARQRRSRLHDASGQVLTTETKPRNKVGNEIDWADVRVFDVEGKPVERARWPRWLTAIVERAEQARRDAAADVKDRGASVGQQIEGDRRRFGRDIVTAQEVLEAVLVESRNQAIKLGMIERWTSDPTLVRGSRGSLGRQVALGSLLDRDLVGDVRAIVRDVAEEISDTMRDERVKVYVSIRLTEFGRNLIGSPTSVIMELPEGVLTQGWQAVRGGKPDRVARRVGALLEKILSQSPRNAAIVEGLVIRGYITRGDGK